MIRLATALALFLTASAPVLAQDGAEDLSRLKDAILKRVKARLEEEHKKILERVGRIIDEELSGRAAPAKPPATDMEKKIAELEAKLDEMEKAKQRLREELNKLRRQAQGKDDEESIKAEAKEKGPQTLEEAQELFNEAFQDHSDKDFDSAIRKNKYIYYQFPDHNLGFTAAYNNACAYSLIGEKAKACEWLEISFKHGFRNYDHVRKDSDLDNIRNEEKYKRLMADK